MFAICGHSQRHPKAFRIRGEVVGQPRETLDEDFALPSLGALQVELRQPHGAGFGNYNEVL